MLCAVRFADSLGVKVNHQIVPGNKMERLEPFIELFSGVLA